MVFEKEGEYVKEEFLKKGQKKDTQIKENLFFNTFKKDNKKRNKGKTDVQERGQKRRMSKNTWEYTQKRKIWRKKKTERKDEHAKTFKFVKMFNKKGKQIFFEKCRSFKYVSKRTHRQRKEEEKKETTDEQMDEQKDTKR